jgi:K+-sensing histidine kinase KdpD
MMLVVVAVAANGYALAGVLAAISAAVWFDFFLTRPYEHFTISRGNVRSARRLRMNFVRDCQRAA